MSNRGLRLVRHSLAVREVAVLRVERVTPKMARIAFGGDSLDGFTSLAPEDHVKVFFPRPGESRPVRPMFGPMGIPIPSFGEKPLARDYTPRAFDARKGELEIDFYLHGHGVASTWASRATAGDVVGIAGPRGSYPLDEEPDWQLFVGDETALPEFQLRVERMPPTANALPVVVVDDAREEQPWATRARVDARWIHREGGETADHLLAALRALQLPAGRGYAWLAGEASEVKRAYRCLLEERGLDAARVHASGHWKRGVVNHDHHEPIELGAS